MTKRLNEYLGVGLYSIREASKLTGVHQARIRRWLFGYSVGAESYPALWRSEIPQAETELAIVSFYDLIEIQFVNAFKQSGLKWSTIKRAAHKAKAYLKSDYPFSTQAFSTDGLTIFVEEFRSSKERAMLDLIRDQYAFRPVILPSLRETLVFSSSDGRPAQWWPLGRRRDVLLDPNRHFGKPIIATERIPTIVLAKAFATLGSEKRVSRWYDVSERSVRQALRYEKQFS